MPRGGTIIEVLIASPSDVPKARTTIERVVHQWNATHSRFYGLSLHPVLWESHAHPEMGGRPQALINQQIVDNADILIGVFWTRLGTETGEAASGTAEEIERFRRAGKKVLIYFSTKGPSLQHFDTDEYNRLLAYKKELGKQGLYWKFSSLENLRQQVTNHLAQVINEIAPTAPKLIALPPGPDPAAQRAAMSRGPLTRIRTIEAKWDAEGASSLGKTDTGKMLMGEVAEILAQVTASPVLADGDPLRARIREQMVAAKNIEHWPITMGEYFAFWHDGAEVLSHVKAILQEIGAGPEIDVTPPPRDTDVPSQKEDTADSQYSVSPDPSRNPKLTVRLEGSYHDSEKRHTIFFIKLKNQSSSVTFEDIKTKVEVENPSQPGDWREFHPLRSPIKWDDLPPRPDERHESGFSFPSHAEAQTGKSFEDFLQETFEPLFHDITLPHPAQASMRHTYYEVLKPFSLRIRFTVEYLPALEGATERREIQYYALVPLCAARKNHIHEPEHPNIVTGWELTRQSKVEKTE